MNNYNKTICKNYEQGCLNILTKNNITYYPLFGFYGYYVDIDGNIYSVKSGKILKQDTNKQGYQTVGLYNTIGKSIRQRVHRLVASVFILNPYNLPQINHKDGDKKNNHVSNLEWCTGKYNSKHSWNTGLRKPSRGEKSGNNKLKEHEVVTIYMSDKSSKELSKMFNISERTIRDIRSGRTWVDTTKNLEKGNLPSYKRFSDEDVIYIYTSDNTIQNLANHYSCPESTIRSILNDKSYRHITKNLKRGKNINRLTKEEVEYIYLTKCTAKEIRNRIDVSDTVISAIRNDRRYVKITEGLQGKSEEDIEREYEISQDAGDDYIGGIS